MKIGLLLAAVVLFIVLDLVWFQFAGNTIKNEIATIARLNADGSWHVRLIPALIVYTLMALAMMIFILPHSTSLVHALTLGALFGLVSYGLYDFTNLATLTAWTWKLALMDVAWGTVLCGAVASALYSLSRLSFFA